MNDKKPNPIEEQFRSSKLYHTLSSSGKDIAENIAQGLGKAGDAINTAVSGSNHNPQRNTQYNSNQQGHPQQNPQSPPYTGNRTVTPPPPPGTHSYTPPKTTYQYVPPVNTNRRPPNMKKPKPYAPPPYRTPPPSQYRQNSSPPMPSDVNVKMVREPSVAKYFITAAAALIYSQSFPMYELWHFIVFAVVIAMTFLVSKTLFKGKKKFVAVPKETPKQAAPSAPEKKEAPKKASASTGNAEVDKIIEDGYEYLRQLRAANDAIPDENTSECIDRIERASAGIFSYIAKKPEKAAQISKFMNYYLPTTIKLLDSYQRLNQQTYKGENISGTINDIDRMLYTIANAFEKQLDTLFSDEAMDIATDISVFETMLKQEGFVETDNIASNFEPGAK